MNIFLLQGDNLIDGKHVVFKDADAVTSNQYSIRLLGDSFKALNLAYDTIPIEPEPHQHPDQAPCTAIVPSEYRALSDRYLHFAFQFIFDGCPHVYLLHP